MKKFTVLLLILCTWYFAGMYRQIPMMMLIVMGLVLVVVMFVLSRYFKRKLNFEFSKQNNTAQKNSDTLCCIQVSNKGKLPVSRFGVKLRFSYPLDNKSAVRKKLYGSADKGNDNILEFNFLAPYCGLIDARIDNVRVYDYLQIFSSGKRIKQSMEIQVFPYEQALRIELPSLGNYQGEPVTEQLSNQSGDNHNEIKQIREYHTGDSNRSIHWNYSARTETLWVKEYQRENDFYFDFVLDTSVMHRTNAEEWDTFYELVSAIILGLLEKEAGVKVHWYDGKYQSINSFDVCDKVQCRELLSKLYHSELICSEQEFMQKISNLNTGAMKLNFSLEWYFDNKPIYKFSRINLEKEIAQMVFMV